MPDESRCSKREKCLAITTVLLLLLILGLVVALVVLGFTRTRQPDVPAGWRQISEHFHKSLNTSVHPCDNFFQFACGSWPQAYPRPPGRNRFGTVELTSDRVNDDTVAALLELDMSKQSMAVQKMKWAFDACMNTTSIDKNGEHALRRILEESEELIGLWPLTAADWKPTVSIEVSLANLKRHYGIDSLLSVSVGGLDLLKIDQATLTFGRNTEDFYLGDGDTKKRIREAYRELIVSVINVTADVSNKKLQTDTAAEILSFEIQVAQLQAKGAERRNNAVFMTIPDVERLFRGFFNVSAYIEALLPSTAATPEWVIVLEKNYLGMLADLLRSTAPRRLYNFLVWRLIYAQLPFLDARLRTLYVDFVKLLGQRANIAGDPAIPRAQTCLAYLTGDVGDPQFGYAVGRVFVDRYFSVATHTEILSMLNDIIDAAVDALWHASWMDTATRTQAIEKAITSRKYNSIGYPKMILDDVQLDAYYAWLGITVGDVDSFADVNLKIRRWWFEKKFGELAWPFDLHEFGGSPAIVGAWYLFVKNSIKFPAGILQWPFFQHDFPKAVNYGNIGTIMGHEMSHAFDDEEFANKTQCIVDQYSHFYYDINGQRVHMNGKKTVGENLSDNSGIQISYRAYRKWVLDMNGGEEEQRLPGLDAFSMDQIFFISFANAFCGEMSAEALTSHLITDEHSPWRDRVIGTLQNFAAFSKAFHCPQTSFMNPLEKCIVW